MPWRRSFRHSRPHSEPDPMEEPTPANNASPDAGADATEQAIEADKRAEQCHLGRWRLVSLIPNDGQEPSFDVAAERAEAVWATVSAPWHPALLAECAELPRIEDVD